MAGPILRQSEQLGGQDLVENAKSKSHGHLLAISERKALHEDVTEVLVLRGDREVVRSLRSACHGAHISEQDDERALKNFSSISAATAQQVLTFYRARASRSDNTERARIYGSRTR